MKTVIGRTLAVVELLAEAKATSPSSIATATGLPTSTVYRYLAVLVEQGFARKEALDYLPGRRLQAIQRGNEGHNEFAALVHEELEAFQRESGLTVFLCVRDGAQAVAIKVIESTHRLKLAMSAGDTLPLYASAPSKLLLALCDPTFRQSYLATVNIRRLASNTVADPAALEAELDQIRGRGYARSLSEVDEMASAVAFPITDRDGTTIMSLAISGPAQWFEGDAVERLIEMTRRYAGLISEKYLRYQNVTDSFQDGEGRYADHCA